MLQRPVAPEPGRDEDPGRAEEDWLAWCEAVEEQLGPDEDEPEDAAPWDVDIDALIAECRQVTAEEAALAARAARRGLPGGTPISDGRRGAGRWPGSRPRRPGTTTGTRAPVTMRSPGRSRPGTGSRPTPPPASTPRSPSSSAAVRARAARWRARRGCRSP